MIDANNMTITPDADDFDARSDDEKTVDTIMGAKGLTSLDRRFGRILRIATHLFANNKHTRKYLELGEECDGFIREAVGSGMKRATAVGRIGDRLHDAGLGLEDIRVNDWVAVFNMARLATGQDAVKDMPPDWVGGVAYRSLAVMKVAISRSGLDYQFDPGWGAKVAEWVRDGYKGEKLADSVKEFKAENDQRLKEAAIANLSPEKREIVAKAEAAKVRDRAESQVRKVAETIRETAIKADLAPDKLAEMLADRGIIPPAGSSPIPRTVEDAERMGREMCEAGNHAAIAALARVLNQWVAVNTPVPSAPAEVAA